MILQLIDYIEGSRSTVFFDRAQNLTFKIFKSYRHPDNANKSCYKEKAFNDWMKQVYISERAAYELISESSLSQYFPKYHPDFTIEKIMDKNLSDISKQYLPDCNLTLDLVQGDAFKQSHPYVRAFCLQHNIELDHIFHELKKMGINSFADATVFFLHGNKKINITGIAINDYTAFQPAVLKNSGKDNINKI